MSFFEIILIAIGLSMDSMAVSVTSGAFIRNLRIKNIVRIALALGFFQAGFTFMGYALGIGFEKHISAFDHWIAFGLLAYLGGRMIYEATKKEEKESNFDPLNTKTLFSMGIATSVDAMAVGISLALLKSTILWESFIIGVCTFIASAIGVYIGNHVGKRIGSKLEIFGGVILIIIGTKILVEHLFFI